jgi:hypothetical protein
MNVGLAMLQGQPLLDAFATLQSQQQVVIGKRMHGQAVSAEEAAAFEARARELATADQRIALTRIEVENIRIRVQAEEFQRQAVAAERKRTEALLAALPPEAAAIHRAALAQPVVAATPQKAILQEIAGDLSNISMLRQRFVGAKVEEEVEGVEEDAEEVEEDTEGIADTEGIEGAEAEAMEEERLAANTAEAERTAGTAKDLARLISGPLPLGWWE